MPPLQQDVPKEENVYESTRSLHEYLMMHFGTKTDLIEPEFEQYAPLSALDFPKRCAEECWAVASDPASAGLGGSKARVLDAGCAVGRSTFELARFFEDCVGVDPEGNEEEQEWQGSGFRGSRATSVTFYLFAVINLGV